MLNLGTYIIDQRSTFSPNPKKSNNAFHTGIETLEIEKKDLQSKCESLEKMVLKFTKGQDNLNKLFGSQRMSFNKECIGCNPSNKKKHTKASSFNMHPKINLTSYTIII